MSAGSIVQVIGAVVDVEFTREAMPKIFTACNVDGTDIVLEVQQQLGDGVVRCIALGSTDGLKRGIPVTNTGAAITVPVGEKTLGRVMDVLGRPIDEAGPIGTIVTHLDLDGLYAAAKWIRGGRQSYKGADDDAHARRVLDALFRGGPMHNSKLSDV